MGHWEIAVPRGGKFEIECEADGPKRGAVARLKLQGIEIEQALEPGTGRYRFPAVELKASPAERLETWVEEAGKPYGVRFVYVKRCE